MVLPAAALSENAQHILKQRYLGPDDKTPEDAFRRVSSYVASAEREYDPAPDVSSYWTEQFYDVLSGLLFLPNSPCLRNAGAFEGELSACFVLPIEDNMLEEDGIAQAIISSIAVQKHGGGTGFSGDLVRPMGDFLRSTHRAACGPIAVLKTLNQVSRDLITQGAFRRGANMFQLHCTHPDILEFICVKNEHPEAIDCFNISVSITDEFLEAYRNDAAYDLVNPRTGEPVAEISARFVMQVIAESAWRTGDPGVFNIDLANRLNPDRHRVSVRATNPCAEQVLPDYGSCTLGSIDISKFVTNQGFFDVPAFRETVALAVRFLDDVVTVNSHPLPKIQQQAENDRRIGLGLMGWHDFLILQGIRYGSEAGIAAAHHVGGIFQAAADAASEELAQERGPYPWFEGSPRQQAGLPPVRNATRTCMAPTGTISILANCSSGIEPRFGLANWRKYFDPLKQEFVPFPEPEVSRAFEAVAKANGFWSEELVRYLADGYPLRNWLDQQISADVLEMLETAEEIDPHRHIEMQAAWQRHLDNAISKTINLPNAAQPEDIETAMVQALEKGCVSVTIYRDGSRDNQILTHGPDASQTPSEAAQQGGNGKDEVTLIPKTEALSVTSQSVSSNGRRRLPDERRSITHKFQVGGFEGYLHVGLYEDGSPGELFVTSHAGSTIGGLLDAWAIDVSMSLQYGVPLPALVRKMRNSRFDPSGMTINPQVPIATSIIDYIGHWLELRFCEGEPAPPSQSTGMACPQCGGLVVIQMGCLVCEACGYEKCG